MMEKIVFTFFGWLIQIEKTLLILSLVGGFFWFIRWRRMAWFVFVPTLCLFIVAGMSPIPLKCIHDLENRYPAPHSLDSSVKGLILLGGSFTLKISEQRSQPSYNMAAGRVIDFVVLANKHQHLPLVFSGGGAVANGQNNESSYMKALLPYLGVELSRVTFEDQSNNTHQNATFTYDLIKPKSDEAWVLVTSAFHMPRSMALFRKAGWNVIAYPVDFHVSPHVSWLDFSLSIASNLSMWSTAMREWGGMFSNYLSGRSDAVA
ncbi:MAG: YdcF family protein [Alphaproteobacteria bacterium]|nr:YdcF family protein [Alphaproteobacteria bacterium]